MLKIKAIHDNPVAWIAIVISIFSATFSYMQMKTGKVQAEISKEQLESNRMQIRPYVKYIPIFSQNKQKFNATMLLENLSSVPANVIYTELTPWIDGITTGVNAHSTTQDVLYEHKNGASNLPPITGDNVKRLLNSNSILEIGVCVIYTSLSPDSRRWQFNAMYKYIPKSDAPSTIFVQEEDILTSKSTCNSKKTRELMANAKNL